MYLEIRESKEFRKRKAIFYNQKKIRKMKKQANILLDMIEDKTAFTFIPV